MRVMNVANSYDFILVDDSTFEALRRRKVYLSRPSDRSKQYVRFSESLGGNKFKHRYLHRYVVSGTARVDHINGDTLDNRKQNLRPCSASQNLMNAVKRKNSISRFKGVSRGRWGGFRARVNFGGKEIVAGHFQSEVEAAMAYNELAKKLFGEYARLNDV